MSPTSGPHAGRRSSCRSSIGGRWATIGGGVQVQLDCLRRCHHEMEGGTMETESGYAPVSGARLYYEVAGNGPPLILLHEGIANRCFWDDQWGPLAREYRVVRYDLR